VPFKNVKLLLLSQVKGNTLFSSTTVAGLSKKHTGQGMACNRSRTSTTATASRMSEDTVFLAGAALCKAWRWRWGDSGGCREMRGSRRFTRVTMSQKQKPVKPFQIQPVSMFLSNVL
jgi:hypothetical protein